MVNRPVRGRTFWTLGAVALLGLAMGGCTMSGFSGSPLRAGSSGFAGLPTPPPPVVAANAGPVAMVESYAAQAHPSNAGLDGLIAHYGRLYQVPEGLIHRVILRESRYNPRARNGPYWGLMQIRYDTARSMGYRGTPEGLLEADTNLRYGVKYLAGAYLVGGRNPDQAMRFYARGYYYDAKRKGLLDLVGL